MNPFRAWNAFWFGPISAKPLGAFRIVFGLILLSNLGLLTVDFDHWLTGVGLCQGAEARALAGPLRPSPLQYFQDPTIVRAWWAGTAVVTLLYTVGWRTPVMGVLVYLGMLGIHHRNISTTSGADSLLVCLAFVMMLAPAGAAYSLDARRVSRRRGTQAEPLIVPWAQRLIQIQLALVYFVTAVLKCNGHSWLDGSATFFVLNNPEIGRFSLQPLPQYPVLVNLMTLSGLLIEFGLAFFLWFRATRGWAILLGCGLHFGILFMVNIPIFGEIMTACYLTFLAPDELQAGLRLLDVRRWFARGVAGRVDAAAANVAAAPADRVDAAEPALRGWHTPPRRELSLEESLVEEFKG